MIYFCMCVGLGLAVGYFWGRDSGMKEARAKQREKELQNRID